MTIRLVWFALLLLTLPARAETAPASTSLLVDPASEASRVRWGIGGNAGSLFPQTAVVLGVAGRLGYLINQSFNVHAELGVQVGSGPGDGYNWNTYIAGRIGVLAELTFARRLSAAVGPVVAYGGWATDTSSARLPDVLFLAQGFFPGADGRIAYTFGDRDAAGSLRGFSIGLDCLVLVAPRATTTRLDSSQSVAIAAAVIPTLMLGYEVR